jgi:hypothetical protein
LRLKKRTAFVPRIVFRSVVLGVIPACAVASCGGEASTGGNAAPNDGSASDVNFSVADAAFDEGISVGVAAVGYCAFCDAAPEANAAPDAAPADAAPETGEDAAPDVFWGGVAAVGYCGFCDAGSETDAGDAPSDAPSDAHHRRG